MKTWQDLHIERPKERGKAVRALGARVRRSPLVPGLATATLLLGILGTASAPAQVTENCHTLGLTCGRLGADPRDEVETGIELRPVCLNAQSIGLEPRLVDVGRTTLASGEPLDVHVHPHGEVALSEGSGDVVEMTSVSRPQVALSLEASRTWVFPDKQKADAWLDDHDAGEVSRRIADGEAGLMRAAAAARLGNLERATETSAPLDSRVEPRQDVLVPGGLPTATPDDLAIARNLTREYPLWRAAVQQVTFEDLRTSARGLTRTSWVMRPIDTRQSGVGILTVTSHEAGDGQGRVLTEVSFLHADAAQRETGTSSSWAGFGGSRRTAVTTTSMSLTPENRAEVMPLLRALERGLARGEMPLPRNLLDPATPVDGDPIAQAFYRWATVARESCPTQELRARATTLAEVGVVGESAAPGTAFEPERLMDRSADGQRRVTRPLVCAPEES